MRTNAVACGAWIAWCWLVSLAGAQQGIQWANDLESARQLAAANNRLVLMHFSATWCHWCKPLEKNVFGQPEVARAIADNYVAVRMDYDQHRQIAKQYNVRGVPWDVVITPDGYWVEDFNSPQTAEQYASRVTKIASREASKANAMYASQQAPSQPSAGPPTVAVGMATPSAPPQQDYRKPAADDRYADYYNSRQPNAGRVDPVNPPYAQQVTPYGPSAATTPQPPMEAPGYAAPPPATGTPGYAAPPTASTPAPVAQPTYALDGYCPVHLMEQSAWTQGDRRWGANHLGKTYLFASEGCQKKFLADPHRYTPALSGNDPVALVDRGQTVVGRREHGCYFGVEPNRRIVLFADEESYQAFSRNPQRYAGQVYAPAQ